jgi:hypothetical protein
MKEYLGVVKDGYIFTNHLSGAEKGDIAYGFEPKGKLLGYKFYAMQSIHTPTEIEYGYISEIDRISVFENGVKVGFKSIHAYCGVDENKALTLTKRKWQKELKNYYYDICEENFLPVYEGSGRVKAKYRVIEVRKDNFVDVYRNEEYQEKYFDGLKEIGYKGQKYAIKVELIEDCDYALDEFVRYAFAMENYKYCVSMKYRKEGFKDYINEIIEDDIEYDIFKLTRYNGFQRVIKR